MRNPESMMPTSASRVDSVIEANQIVGREAFKVMWEAKYLSQIGQGNAQMYEAAQSFLNGPRDPRRGRTR